MRDKFVPKHNACNKPHWSEKGSVPLDVKTRALLKQKDKLHRIWLNAHVEDEKTIARENYTKARNKAKSAVRAAKRAYEKRIAIVAKSNPKPFWAYTRRNMKTVTSVSALLEDVNDPSSIKYTDKAKSDILQRQFLSVFTVEPDDEIPDAPQLTETIPELRVSEENVRELLMSINVNKTTGPDELHPKMLKELPCCLIAPITSLFNSTLSSGVLPNDWKLGRISPIYKKGSKKHAENYRPISLTAILCKLMEKLIRSHLMEHLKKHKLLSSKQFGFISGRSTTTQLLYFIDKCVNSIAEGNVVDVIYFDFAKAFDSVPHKRLLQKLKSFGIAGNVYKWIKAFLIGRKQFVSVNRALSEYAEVLSGVPQGTVLGPILFVIYINDLLDQVNSDGVLYADDTKIFKTITCKEDAYSLQSDIDKLEAWTKIWLMKFHPGKCHALTLGKFENIKYAHNYKVCGQDIEHVSVEKDLGIHIDEEMSFEEHICIKARVANALMGKIRRTFTNLDGNTFKKLYTSMVRQHLEYGHSVWCPFLLKHIHLLERVQERATKLVDGYGDLDYGDRLRKLGLTTLRFRRLRGDLIEMYKHFHSYDKSAVTGPSFSATERPSRRHKYQLREPLRDRIRGTKENSFYGRVIKLWNDLPRNVAEAESVNSFKNGLDKHLKHHPWMFC